VLKTTILICIGIVIAAFVVFRHFSPNAAVQEKAMSAVQEKAEPAIGTVAWYDDVMGDADRDQWLDLQYEYTRNVVGNVGEDTEKWLAVVASDLVYVEASKCEGDLRPSESEACQVRLSRKFQKTFNRCSNLRPSEVRSCVVTDYPEVDSQEKAQWQKLGKER
jgi:hypothetical protein